MALAVSLTPGPKHMVVCFEIRPIGEFLLPGGLELVGPGLELGWDVPVVCGDCNRNRDSCMRIDFWLTV